MQLPCIPGCGLWFDHHSSEQEQLDPFLEIPGENRLAPSAANTTPETEHHTMKSKSVI